MIIPKEIDISEALVALTFIGGGSGESIVVNVGGRLVGVVDCCGLSYSESARSRTMQVLPKTLARCDNPVLAFILLSHPHLDHFGGMHSLIHRYRDRLWRACLFQGTTEYELAKLFEEQDPGVERGRSSYRFSRRFAQLLKAYKNSLTRGQRLAVSDRTEIIRLELKLPDGTSEPLVISCLAPSDDDCRKFLDEVKFKNFVRSASQRAGRPAQLCNRVSVVTRIDFGDTRIILGGDAEARSWSQVLEKNARSDIECNVFKVSHHGSGNGSPSFLCDVISKKRLGQDTVAVVAPSILHGLPEDDVLSKLRGYFDEVVITAADDGHKPDTSSLGARFRGAKNIRGLARWKSCHRTIVFDAKGRRVRKGFPNWVLSDQQ